MLQQRGRADYRPDDREAAPARNRWQLVAIKVAIRDELVAIRDYRSDDREARTRRGMQLLIRVISEQSARLAHGEGCNYRPAQKSLKQLILWPIQGALRATHLPTEMPGGNQYGSTGARRRQQSRKKWTVSTVLSTQLTWTSP